MDERSFYFESQTAKPAELNCPHCKTAASYSLQWMLRRKKDRLPGHADERDKARFAKAQSYMVLQDDKVACSNLKCRKRFDISGIKTMAFLSAEQEKELAAQKPQRSERPERRRDNRQDNRQNNRNRPKQKAGGRGQKAGKRNARQGGGRSERGNERGNVAVKERSGNRAEEPNGNRLDYPGGNHFADQRGNRFDDQRGNRAGGGQGKRRQQQKGKKKRPEVYFPSDYVNYRP